MSVESVMPCNHLILRHPLLRLPSVFPSIRVFSIESALHVRWPKYWSFNFNTSPSSEYSGLISFKIDWFDFFLSFHQFWMASTHAMNFLVTSLLCRAIVVDWNYMHVPVCLGHSKHWLNSSFFCCSVQGLRMYYSSFIRLFIHSFTLYSFKQQLVDYLSTMGQSLARPWRYKIWNTVSFLSHKPYVKIDSDCSSVWHLHVGIYQGLENASQKR